MAQCRKVRRARPQNRTFPSWLAGAHDAPGPAPSPARPRLTTLPGQDKLLLEELRRRKGVKLQCSCDQLPPEADKRHLPSNVS